MDGFYLSSNMGPLQSLADGRVHQVMTTILDDRNEGKNESDKGELVAYKIVNSESIITRIECLINTSYGLFHRSFNLFNRNGTIDDDLRQSASYGFGFHDVEMERFMDFREWYLQQTATSNI